MKTQTFFSSKDKSKKLKCRLLQFLFGALRVKEKQQSYFNLYLPQTPMSRGINPHGNNLFTEQLFYLS